MKKLLVGLLALGSISIYANECTITGTQKPSSLNGHYWNKYIIIKSKELTLAECINHAQKSLLEEYSKYDYLTIEHDDLDENIDII